jgi:hypothetical protein
VGISIREHDERKVRAFLASMSTEQVDKLIDKYLPEMDAEIADDIVKAVRYVLLREDGAEIPWAKMSACRRAARAAGTDSAFFEHARARMESMPRWQLDHYLSTARTAGINTAGKFYCGGLGAPDDKHAWVSGVGDIKKVCEIKNLTCDGHVKHRGTEMPPPPPVDLAPDLVQEMVVEECKADPGLAEKVKKSDRALQGLRERVKAKYTRQPRSLTS